MTDPTPDPHDPEPAPGTQPPADYVWCMRDLAARLPDVATLIDQQKLPEVERKTIAAQFSALLAWLRPPPRSGLGRLSVYVTPDTQMALELLAEKESVTITEALRRLVGYGELVYRTIRIDGDEVLTRHGDQVDTITLTLAPDQPDHETEERE